MTNSSGDGLRFESDRGHNALGVGTSITRVELTTEQQAKVEAAFDRALPYLYACETYEEAVAVANLSLIEAWLAITG